MEFLLLILFIWNVILSIKLHKTNERIEGLVMTLVKTFDKTQAMIDDLYSKIGNKQ